MEGASPSRRQLLAVNCQSTARSTTLCGHRYRYIPDRHGSCGKTQRSALTSDPKVLGEYMDARASITQHHPHPLASDVIRCSLRLSRRHKLRARKTMASASKSKVFDRVGCLFANKDEIIVSHQLFLVQCRKYAGPSAMVAPCSIRCI